MSEPGSVVVTGGTGALGRALVEVLLERGDRVAVPYRSVRGYESLRRDLGEPAGLWGGEADVANPESVERFMTRAREALGPIDGVAAIAGAYQGNGPLESAPASEWDAMLAGNLHSAWATCRAALPHLLENGGSVVMVSARSVATGGAGAAAYTVSKAGVEALTRALAAENRERNVRFNAVAPGIIDTPANRAAMPGADTTGWVPPAQIARVIAFLLGPESQATTGSIVAVHGSGA